MTQEQNQEVTATALTAEKKRVTDIKAAFLKDAVFALEAIEAGWSVMEAKAQRCDRLEAARAAEVRGDTGVPYGDSEQGPPVNFLEQAWARAVRDKITRTEAMRKLAAEQPKLYQDFLASESRRPVLSK